MVRDASGAVVSLRSLVSLGSLVTGRTSGGYWSAISSKFADQRGSATLEFLLFSSLSALLLSFAIDLSLLQGRQLAVDSILRHGLRAEVLALETNLESGSTPGEAAVAVGRSVGESFGLDGEALSIELQCLPSCEGAADEPPQPIKLVLRVRYQEVESWHSAVFARF